MAPEEKQPAHAAEERQPYRLGDGAVAARVQVLRQLRRNGAREATPPARRPAAPPAPHNRVRPLVAVLLFAALTAAIVWVFTAAMQGRPPMAQIGAMIGLWVLGMSLVFRRWRRR